MSARGGHGDAVEHSASVGDNPLPRFLALVGAPWRTANEAEAELFLSEISTRHDTSTACPIRVRSELTRRLVRAAGVLEPPTTKEGDPQP